MTVAPPSAGRRAFRLTLAGTVVSALGQGLTLPFLIVYLHDVLGLPLPAAGVVIAGGAVVGLGASALGGTLGDAVGLGRLAAVGLAVQAAGTALLAAAAAAAAPGAAAGVVAVAGVAGTAIGQASVYPAMNGLIAFQVPPERQSQAFALRFGLLNAGLGAGALVSGWIVDVRHPATFQLIYAVDAGSTLLFALLVALGMRRSPGYAAAADRAAGPAAGGYREVLRDRAFVGYLLVTLALGLFGYAQLNGPWAAFVTGQGGSTRIVGLGFAANTAAIVLLQMVAERATRRWRRSRLLAATAGVWAVAWVVSGLAALPGAGLLAPIGFVTSLAVFGIGETLYSPVGGALPNVLAPERLRGRYNALAVATWPVSSLIGAPIAGVLLGGPSPALWVGFVTAGCLATAVGALLFGRLLPPAVERPPPAGH